jgi:hypothetical protein
MLIKLDKNGIVEWEKNYGGPVSFLIQCQQTSDGGYIASGFYRITGDNNDAWLMKTDSNGNELWNKAFGTETTRDIFHSIHQTSDNGYILPGWNTNRTNRYSDGYIVKTDVDGNIEWEKTIGTGNDFLGINKFDQINMGRQAFDGGYIFTGYTASWFLHYLYSLGSKIRLIKTNAEGNIEWDQTYGNSLFFNWGLWCEPTSDGGYIVSGSKNGYGRLINTIKSGSGNLLSCKLCVFKTDSEGIIEWEINHEDATARCVQETNDGGYIIAGHKGPYTGTKGILLIKTDETGNFD